MIRVLTLFAAVAALVVPAAHYIDDALGTGVRKLGTTGALAAPVALTDEPDAGAEVSLLYRGAVAVGEDGSGVVPGTFPTTLGGIAVRYVLVVENGCAGTDARCPVPVRELTVTLNDDVVFQEVDGFKQVRRGVALNSVEAEDNRLVIAAKGAPRSAARVRIIAISYKAEQVSRLYRGTVNVGRDGSGVELGSFPTTVGGRDVRYAIVIENGCEQNDPAPCPAPVRELTVTLNNEVVFQNDEFFTLARHDIALNAIGAEDNRLTITARGVAFSGARVSIFAVQHDTSCKRN